MTAGFSLEGRTVIVTGAGGLLGRRHAGALAAAGASVLVADIDASAVSSVLDTLGGTGGAHTGTVVDVTDPASVRSMVADCLQWSDAIDGLINNAAINDAVERPEGHGDLSRFESYPLESWRRVLDVNVTGTFLVSQAVAPVMADNGGGSIVNVASTYGLVGPDQRLYRNDDGTQTFYKNPAYPSSKGAVIAFTRYLAAYYGGAGVRVNTLSPGGVENGQDVRFVDAYAERVPLGRMATADEYAGAVVFLCSDASAYMTGANLVVDGGWTTW